MSSANRQKRQQNRETRKLAAEEHLRRAKRQRIVFAAGGLALAVVVALILVVKPWSGGDDSASSTTTTLPKRCVAVSDPLPKGAPAVPIPVGPPPTALVKKDLKVGTGAVVKAGQTVTVDYIGVSCSSGTIFDSSYASGKPITTPLGNVVEGWQEGIPGMRVGGTRLLGLPPELAYADSPPPGSGIVAGETLWFVVHMRATKPTVVTTTVAPTTVVPSATTLPPVTTTPVTTTPVTPTTEAVTPPT